VDEVDHDVHLDVSLLGFGGDDLDLVAVAVQENHPGFVQYSGLAERPHRNRRR
jgi:hypothetical protein